MGLVQEVTPNGEQLERAVVLAETIARQAPLGVYATLKSARLARREGEAAAFAPASLAPHFQMIIGLFFDIPLIKSWNLLPSFTPSR